jgi:hypothetical protein
MRDFADVSMNLQPNDRASASPSESKGQSAKIELYDGSRCTHELMERREMQRDTFEGIRRTLLRHLSLTLQITLVAHDNDREIILILDPQNLLLERHDLLEALSTRNAIHQQEAFTGPHVLLAHRRVFFLACGIEDI